MSYREENDSVILTMSREDYERLLMRLGMAAGHLSREGYTHAQWQAELAFMNRLNQGNPNYTPYQVEKKKS